MKPTTPRRTRRLLARAASMNHAAEEFDDYGPEPNMKLSHAFLVVLALHVVAVGGLYAFTSMKAGNQSAAKADTKAALAAPAAEKAMPLHESAGDNGSSSGGSGDQGNSRPPLESKPAPVAKVSKSAATRQSPEKTIQPSKGLLASARGILQKAGIGGAAAVGISKLAAQEATSPSSATQPEAAPAPTGGPRTYTVKAGDTITRIASSLGVTIPDLEKVNGLAGNAILQVGQILKVPDLVPAQVPTQVVAQASPAVAAVTQGIPAADAPVTAPSATVAETAGGTQYTVVKGDNPWKIAKKFKISQEELMKANGITDPKKIQIGQVLRIPAGAGKAKAAK